MRLSFAPLLLCALFTSLGPGRAAAQDDAIAVERYRPAPLIDDGYALRRPAALGDVRFGVRIDGSFAWRPLVVEQPAGDAALVGRQFVASAQLAVGLLDRLVFYAGVPAQLAQDGRGVGALPEGDGAQFGDLWLGARGVLFGQSPDAPFALALELEASFPTATAADETQRYSGDPGGVISPAVLLEVRPHAQVWITANLGARLRTLGTLRVANLRVGHQLSYGLGVGVDVVRELVRINAEVFGDSSFETFGEADARASSPLEWQLGVRFSVLPGVWVGASAGGGIVAGHGAPDFRAVIGLGYQMPENLSIDLSEPEPEGDDDEPGAADDEDDEWADYDADGDGLPDSEDGCPDHPEEADGDGDGCPAGMLPEGEGASSGGQGDAPPTPEVGASDPADESPADDSPAETQPDAEAGAEAEPDAEAEPEAETDLEAEPEAETAPDTEREAETDRGDAADPEAEVGSDDEPADPDAAAEPGAEPDPADSADENDAG